MEVFCPESTAPRMQQKLRERGAKVHVSGKNWNEADESARKVLAMDSSALYVPPFDHPEIWEGHSTIVDELVHDFEVGNFGKPDVIAVSVGGGGLLRGIQIGLKRLGWADTVSILAVETSGTASYCAAVNAGKPVRLNSITSIATSLGALQVIPSVLDPDTHTISVVVDDYDAIQACVDFADDNRVLVEPACGASLAVMVPHVLSKWMPTVLNRKQVGLDCSIDNKVDNNKSGLNARKDALRVVIVVCGGNSVSVDMLTAWRTQILQQTQTQTPQ